jgi:uncharacterized protein involved in high-affinity Fe2+ transport
MLLRFPILLFALLAGPAYAAPLGGPMLREGLEIIPMALAGAELDRAPPGAGTGNDAIFLAAEVQAGKGEAHGFPEHAFVPYLSISYALTKDGAPTFKRAGLLYPVASKSGPHYAAGVQMNGPGNYRLTYIVSPPSSHGMLRRTDGAGGVPDWWKPFTASWTFTYPLNTK